MICKCATIGTVPKNVPKRPARRFYPRPRGQFRGRPAAFRYSAKTRLDAELTLCAVSESLPEEPDKIVLAYKTGDAGKDLIDGICNLSGSRS
jgi:hypothetical protein